MFSGRWKESNESFIHLDILDPNITVEGTLYQLIVPGLISLVVFLGGVARSRFSVWLSVQR